MTAHGVDPVGHTLTIMRALADEDTSWKEQAACRGSDPRKFFLERGESDAPAKALCASCPVTFECADYGARYSPRDGIWGGMAPRALARWRKTRGAIRPRGPAPSRHGVDVRQRVSVRRVPRREEGVHKWATSTRVGVVNTYEARIRAEAGLRMLAAGEVEQARTLFSQAVQWLRDG